MLNKRSEILFTLLAVVIDAVMIFLAFVSAYGLRSQTEIIQVVYLWPFRDYLWFITLMIPFWVIIFALSGLYRNRIGRAHWGEFTKVFLAVSASIMFFVAWVFLSRILFFSRLIVIYAWILATLFVFFGRLFINSLQRSLYRYGIGVQNVILIGKSETAATLKRELEVHEEFGYRVINGLLEPDIETIRQFLAGHPTIDEIIVADSDLPSARIYDIISLAEEHNIAFRLVPNLFEVKTTNVEVETLAAIPVIAYHQTPLIGWLGILKRIFDVVLASFALLLLSPIFVILAALIKADSPGPVYYRHKRLGLKKKPFFLYKFRTMKPEYCTGDDFQGQTDAEIFADKLHKPELVKEFQKQQKLKDDPRVTRLGRILRKTSLDELPQIFNVLIGHLSLVGPRPIVQDELAKYGPNRHRLFIVKPGLTGLWQVSGRSDMPYNERVKLDMYYIENWSLWSDIVILIKTVFVVLFRKNAY